MLRGAPIARLTGVDVSVSDGRAEVAFEVRETFFHGGGGLHGGIYAFLLDNALYFAAASREPECFLLTRRLETRFHRPVSSGSLLARGWVTGGSGRRHDCEGVLLDDAGRTVADASGEMVRTTRRLGAAMGYR